ncbi:MAG: radical SAM protein [Chloroflexia bacterium]
MPFLERLRSWLTPARPLAPGMFHYQSPPDASPQYRLHLRIEPNGQGLLIVNAATVLHLNQTATEYAYWLVRGADEQQVVRTMTQRYRVDADRVRSDFRDLKERILTLATSVDLAPDVYLSIERTEPFSAETSAPYRVDIALTYRIDESGALDPEARKRVDRELSTAEWQEVLDRLWRVGVPHVVFTGGEPTLREDLVELIRHGESLGMVTGLLSDGRRLKDRGYLDRLLFAGLDHLQITLASHDPALHDRLIGRPGAWEETMAGLRNALAADLYVVVRCIVTPENAGRAAETVAFLAGQGVAAVALSAPAYPPSSREQEQVRQGLQAAEEAAHQQGLTIVWDLAAPYSRIHPIELAADLSREQVLAQHLYVEPDGDVLPAQGYGKVLGNLLRDPWKAIWEHPARPRC